MKISANAVKGNTRDYIDNLIKTNKTKKKARKEKQEELRNVIIKKKVKKVKKESSVELFEDKK